MKHTDDYHAKIKLWAKQPRVVRMPEPVGIPRFGHKRFNSYAEMNAWKKEILMRIASEGGVQWRK